MENETPEETPAEATDSAANPEPEAEQVEEASAGTETPAVAAEAEETPAEAEAAPAETADDAAPTEAAAAEEPVSAEETAEPTPAETPTADAAAELTLGSGEPAEAGEPAEPKPAPVIRGKIDKLGVAMGTGRRKTAVARVRIKEGDGQLVVNGRSLEDYCPMERDRLMIEAPLRATETHGNVDIWVRVKGGGTTGQTGAIVLGISRALEAMNPDLHVRLSEGGFLTRDGRMVERKKYGFKKARKSFQFSKR